MSAGLVRFGELVPEVDERDAQIAALEQENARLRADVTSARAEAHRAKAEATRALAALRNQLAPLHRALQMVFGEIEAAGVTGDAPGSEPAASSDPRTAAVWESWKSRLGGGCAKVIDALLLHREMNTQQLAIATGLHRTTIPKLIYQLNKAGLISKNGGRFALKALS